MLLLVPSPREGKGATGMCFEYSFSSLGGGLDGTQLVLVSEAVSRERAKCREAACRLVIIQKAIFGLPRNKVEPLFSSAPILLTND